MHIYIYIYMHICMCIYIYIERERDTVYMYRRDVRHVGRQRALLRLQLVVHDQDADGGRHVGPILHYSIKYKISLGYSIS